ncbi:hypothetical protein PTKIN_Ptkin14bG0204000 [Pterospermum kingtungense]
MGILNLLLKRCHGNTFSESYYFSLLSTEKGQNFVVKENIYLPEIYRICEVHGPCNGLLCLQVTDDKVALWNPSTREIKFLPQPTIQPPPPHDDIEFFSIHTSFSPIGFGFDSNSEDYKVATFVDHCFRDEEGRSFLDCRSQVHLYSLKSDSWKEIPHPNERTFVSGNSFFNSYIDGVYYWFAIDQEEGIVNYLHFILSFNFANEKFSTISLPNFGGSFEHFNLEILDFNGLLGAFVFPNEGDEKSFDLWVMNNGLWTKEFSIGPISGVHMPLGFSENGELFLEGSNHELLLFDPTTQEIRNLGIHDYPEVMRLIAYVESLVPLNGTSELEEHVVRQAVGHHQIDMGNKQV